MMRLCSYLLSFLFLITTIASAESPEKAVVSEKMINISHLASNVQGGLIHLDAQANFNLPSVLTTALTKGTKLVFIADIQILKKIDMWPDKKVLNLQWYKQLHFYALTRKYVVEDLTFDKQASFNSLNSALAHLGHYENIPITEASLVSSSQATHMRVRIKLSRKELPLPLRLKSYLSLSWPLSSDWHQWSF